jgi:hypothetical protein
MKQPQATDATAKARTSKEASTSTGVKLPLQAVPTAENKVAHLAKHNDISPRGVKGRNTSLKISYRHAASTSGSQGQPETINMLQGVESIGIRGKTLMDINSSDHPPSRCGALDLAASRSCALDLDLAPTRNSALGRRSTAGKKNGGDFDSTGRKNVKKNHSDVVFLRDNVADPALTDHDLGRIQNGDIALYPGGQDIFQLASALTFHDLESMTFISGPSAPSVSQPLAKQADMKAEMSSQTASKDQNKVNMADNGFSACNLVL